MPWKMKIKYEVRIEHHNALRTSFLISLKTIEIFRFEDEGDKI